MKVCLECPSKVRKIVHLEEKLDDLSKNYMEEMKRTTVLSNALIQIYGIAKDKMWHPSSFEVRGESGFKESDKFVTADLAAMKPPVGYTK